MSESQAKKHAPAPSTQDEQSWYEKAWGETVRVYNKVAAHGEVFIDSITTDLVKSNSDRRVQANFERREAARLAATKK